MVTVCPKNVIFLHRNDCMEIGFGRLMLEILDEWLSYRGGCLDRFNCS